MVALIAVLDTLIFTLAGGCAGWLLFTLWKNTVGYGQKVFDTLRVMSHDYQLIKERAAAQADFDKRVSASINAYKGLTFSYVAIVPQKSLSDRLKAKQDGDDPWMLAAKREIEQLIRGQA